MTVSGTKSSGTDFIGLNEALKQRYEGPFATNIESEMEVKDVFTEAGDFEVIEGPDGKQINLGHYLSSGGGISAVAEDDYMPDSVAPLWKQSNVTVKKIAARVDISGTALTRVKQGPAAFADWASIALPDRAQRVAFHKDRMMVGTGTGIIGRISGTPDGTGDAITSAFGITSLEGALNQFLVGDNLRYASDAAASSLRAGALVVTAINYGGSTFDTALASAPLSAATATSAAASDYVFLGSANVNGAAKEIMGLEGILDDGTNVTTFQGLLRATYPSLMNAQVLDSTTANGSLYGGVLSEDLLDYADALCWERAKGAPNVILVNRNGQRSFWKSMRADRTINDPQGQFQGGKAKNGLKVLLGDRVVTIKSARKVPSSRAYGVDTSSMRRFRIGTGHWEDVTGAVWRPVQDSTGVKHAYYALWIEEEECGSIFPAKNFKLTNLAAA
jgi:hypothetical protein